MCDDFVGVGIGRRVSANIPSDDATCSGNIYIHAHTHTHTYAHACTHMHVRMHARTYMHARTHARTGMALDWGLQAAVTISTMVGCAVRDLFTYDVFIDNNYALRKVWSHGVGPWAHLHG